MLVVSDREAIGRCVAEYEALRSGAESWLVHRRPIDDGELEWCGDFKDRTHWTCTRVRGDAATPIAVGDLEAVALPPEGLSQSRPLAELRPPTIMFGGRRRHLEPARGRHVLGSVSAGGAAVLLGALGRDVGLIYVPAAGSPQLLHACSPLALTSFDVDRVVKDRSCADAPRGVGPRRRAPDAATPSGEATARDEAAAPGSSGPAARDELAVPVRTPAKVHLEHRRTVCGVVATELGPTLPEAIVNAFLALIDRALLYVPPKDKKALGIQDVERVIAYMLELCELGCRDIGGMTGTIHDTFCERLGGVEISRYTLARVIELLHEVGTCIIEKLSPRRWGLRFVGLNVPTSEHHLRFLAETETLCKFPLPPGTPRPTPRRKLARRQKAGARDPAPRPSTPGRPAGPRAQQAGAEDEAVLGDTSRTGKAKRRPGRAAATEAKGRGRQLELLFGEDEAAVGSADLQGVDEVDGASEFRAALDKMAELLSGAGRQGAAQASGVAVAGRPEAHDERRGEGPKGGELQHAGPARVPAGVGRDELDDVVRRLVGLGGAESWGGGVTSDEPALDPHGGAGPVPNADGAQAVAPCRAQCEGGAPRPAGELGWTCEGMCRRDSARSSTSTPLELVDVEGLGAADGHACDDAVRERRSLVLEAIEGEARSSGRGPAPPVSDFRLALAGRLPLRSNAAVVVHDAAAAASWRPSSTRSGTHRLREVVRAKRRARRCLSLLGPRGPPHAGAVGAAPWCCLVGKGRERKAEADQD